MQTKQDISFLHVCDISSRGTHGHDPILASALDTRPIVIANLCFTLLVRAQDLTRHTPVLQERFHPGQLRADTFKVQQRPRISACLNNGGNSQARRSTLNTWNHGSKLEDPAEQ